jgi:CheY-like chemotaxis protein
MPLDTFKYSCKHSVCVDNYMGPLQPGLIVCVPACLLCVPATAQQFDFVLMDIGMPGINGYECVRQLRELPTRASARVISVTA